MNEEEARDWLDRNVPRETIVRLERFAALLADAATRQNLIAASSLSTMWSRHIVDGAQLATACAARTPLIDIGSGAGLPGLVLAILLPGPVTLVEPRGLRAAFLEQALAALDLADRVTVSVSRMQAVAGPPVATITARAVAGIDALLAMSLHRADAATRWVLPRGRSAAADVAAAERLWHGRFTMVPSITDSTAAIVIVEDVRPRARTRR